MKKTNNVTAGIDDLMNTYVEEPASLEPVEKKKAGRPKGRQTRISIAITDENKDYVKTMAKLCGISETEFINKLIEKSRVSNPGLYERAKAARDEIFNLIGE